MRDDHGNPSHSAGPAAADEQVLRSLFAGAVQGLEPSEGALERLRHAVPARRARKRQALLGAAVAVLLAGTAVPAALHLGDEDEGGSAAGHSAMAGHGEAQGPRPGGAHADDSGGAARPHPAQPAGKGQDPTAGGTGERPSPQPGGSPSGGVTAGPSGSGAPAAAAGNGPQPPAGAAAAAPGCTADQLGVAGSARAPEADGKVYGSFKVTNVSAKGCTVTGPDTVTAASVAHGPPPAQPPGVTVTGHKAGDPASGLPDPSAEAPALLLQPKQAYEVLFAWVPSPQSCPAAPGPSATPRQQDGTAQSPAARSDGAPANTAAGGAADTPAGAGDTAGGTQRPSGPVDPDPAGVAVSHAPATATGAPVTQTTIPQACGGTVYRTGLIPQPAP
ncbi:hypothetical protein AB0469_04400 [Streptomyces sp. NPDC093801]|uniref:hypothetical protein n=1 Tax=Streptomyces sp. NPDC093801 TaxID=3155203 RepID=UPI00344E16AE